MALLVTMLSSSDPGSFDSLTVSGAAVFKSTISVSGAAHFKTTISVGGAATFADTLTVSGDAQFISNVSIGGNLYVAGTSTLSGAVVANTTLNVQGATTLDDTLTVSGAAVFKGSVSIDGDVTHSGNAVVKGNLLVEGTTTMSGNAVAKGTLLVEGVATLSAGAVASGEIYTSDAFVAGLNTGNDITLNAGTYSSLYMADTDSVGNIFGYAVTRHATSATLGATYGMFKSNGSHGGETIVADDDLIGRVVYAGYDGVDYARAAEIDVYVDGAPGADDMPGRIEFKTTPDGSQTPATALTLDNAKKATFAGALLAEDTVTISGAATLKTTLNVEGATTLSGAATMKGTVTLEGAAVAKSTLLAEDTVTISGAATLKTSLNVEGATSLSGAATLKGTVTLEGAAVAKSTLLVEGAVTISGAATFNTTVQVDGAARFDSTVTVSATAVFKSSIIAPDILDASSNEIVGLDSAASAVNYIAIVNASTGNNPGFNASGDDANVGITFNTKGTGQYIFAGNADTQAIVNWFEDTSNGSNKIAVQAPASISSDQTVTWKSGSSGYPVLDSTDGDEWVDWSGTIGFTGFSVDPTVNSAYYKKIGKICMLEFNLSSGTSNATTLTITGLPFTAASNWQVPIPLMGYDNGTFSTLIDGFVSTGTSVITCRRNASTTGWTASGTKNVSGLIIYETT